MILKPRDGELSEEAIAARQYWVQTGLFLFLFLFLSLSLLFLSLNCFFSFCIFLLLLMNSYFKGDVVGSIDKFPKQLYIEKQVLRGLLVLFWFFFLKREKKEKKKKREKGVWHPLSFFSLPLLTFHSPFFLLLSFALSPSLFFSIHLLSLSLSLSLSLLFLSGKRKSQLLRRTRKTRQNTENDVCAQLSIFSL